MHPLSRGLCSVVLVLAVASCDDNNRDDAAATTDTQSSSVALEVFDPGSDDLCDWVEGDEVVDLLNAAGASVEGPAVAEEPNLEDATGWSCRWVLASGETVDLGTRPTSGDSGDSDDVVEYEAPGQVMDPGSLPISGHPDLSDGVIVSNQAFLRFGFIVPGASDQLNLSLNDGSGGSSEGYESILMRTADAILGELGWVEP